MGHGAAVCEPATMTERNLTDLNLATNLDALNARISSACLACSRQASEVTLIAASKTRSQDEVRRAFALGIRNFGENYVAEALEKIEGCAKADPAPTWHFIGRIQSNKTKLLAHRFDWVHTVERAGIARRLASHRALVTHDALNVCLQVNVDADPNKAGVLPRDLSALVDACLSMPQLRLRGLMTILSRSGDARASYETMAQLAADQAPRMDHAQRSAWDCLSMGMSGDLEAAIAAGATHLRIGTALFGARR